MANVFVEEKYLQDIADAIREKNGTETKYPPSEMSDAIKNLSSSSGESERYPKKIIDLFGRFRFAQAVDSSYEGEIEEWMLNYDDTINIKDVTYMFEGCKKITSVPLISLGSATQTNNMFQFCNNLRKVPLLDTKNINDFTYMFGACKSLTTIPQLDLSNAINISNMFRDCESFAELPLLDTSKVTNMCDFIVRCYKLKHIPQFDTRNVTNMTGFGYWCRSLETVSKLDVRSVLTFKSSFQYAVMLKECWFINIKSSLQLGSGTLYGHLLTLESLLHLIKECRAVGAPQTLTVGSANLEKLNGIYVKLIEITDEMRAEDDLIDEKLPFEVCESTDEGAMTIEDYMFLKQWSLA